MQLAGEVPYMIVKGHRFYDRKEIKDIVSYMQLVQNGESNVCFERIVNVPSRKIGKKTIELLKIAADENGLSLFDAIGTLMQQKKYPDFYLFIN